MWQTTGALFGAMGHLRMSNGMGTVSSVSKLVLIGGTEDQ
jgi:hypothetical protein